MVALGKKSALSALKKIDRALYKVGKSIEILEPLRWDVSVRKKFLADWHKGSPQLPKISYPRIDLKSDRKILTDLIKASDSQHPIGIMLNETASSYHKALHMLESLGKKSFLDYSIELYGHPDDPCIPGGPSTLKAATRFIHAVRQFKLAEIMPPTDLCLLPEYVVDSIKRKAKQVFKDKKITIKTDPRLVSKASAGPNRIRVRSSTCFAAHDVEQLIQHELLVHTLTIQNGRLQPFKIFGLSSPRTTCTQEGLAVFAEFITGSIDVNRLHRISARVKAIQLAIDGADFVEVFRFYMDQGQSEMESYNSTARIFRGGKVTGGVVFTKDLVYLKGFVEIHRFFLQALREDRYIFPQYLFAGRMKSVDVEVLAGMFENETLHLPFYEPEWVKNRSTLLAFLLSSSVMNSLGLSKLA